MYVHGMNTFFRKPGSWREIFTEKNRVRGTRPPCPFLILGWAFGQCEPWHCRQEVVSEFLTQHQDHFIFLPCDKNVGKCMVMCKCLYYKKLLQIYSDETQFEVLADFHTPKEATQYATKLLHQHARTCGVHKHWRESKQSAAPHSFISPKNKMREWQGGMEIEGPVFPLPPSDAVLGPPGR